MKRFILRNHGHPVYPDPMPLVIGNHELTFDADESRFSSDDWQRYTEAIWEKCEAAGRYVDRTIPPGMSIENFPVGATLERVE